MFHSLNTQLVGDVFFTENLVGEFVARQRFLAPVLHIYVRVFGVFEMEVALRDGAYHHVVGSMEILVLELVELRIGGGNHKVGKEKRKDTQQDGTHNVGHDKAVKAHPTIEEGDDFVALRQLRGEPDDRDEGEEREKQGDKVRDEVHVVARDDIHRSGVVEILHVLRDVEHNDDGHQQGNGIEYRADELTQKVSVHDGPFPDVPLEIHRSCVSFFIVFSFGKGICNS